MPEEKRLAGAAAAWKNQPEEKKPVTLEDIINRRTVELSATTRSEILASIGAALLLVTVMIWRFSPHHDRFLQAGFAAILAWTAISVYRFRRVLWKPEPPAPDAVAATGVEFYRQELERRRDHLRNAWIWHGPLVLACLMLVGVLIGKASMGLDRLWSVLPLVILLAVWTGFGLQRRRRRARELQRELDSLPSPGR